jgi:hypothetical protein
MLKNVLLMTSVAICGAAMAAEDGGVLTGDELRKAISGKTVYLMTPIGAEIPIRYRPNGSIHGRTSASLATLGGESVSSDTGRWWVVRELLCQQWKNWSDSRQYCYKFRIAGAAVQWQRNDGATGSARIASN